MGRETEDDLSVKLAESAARQSELQLHLDEATNIIFRLRPQREECTESEIEEDYRKLILKTENWINNSFASFLDDDSRGLGELCHGKRTYSKFFSPIPQRFLYQPNRWIEAKEYVLIAIVMGYLVDKILSQPFSVFLRHRERDLLVSIETAMARTQPQKDLVTIRTWRTDTATAVYESLKDRYAEINERLTTALHAFLYEMLPCNDSESTIQSLSENVIIPAVKLAHKTQSGCSIWTFRSSGYSSHPPGEYASRLPEFLANIHSVDAINMSKKMKRLKPDIDLVTQEQKDNLLYVLDITPGLFCQRVAVGNCLPIRTITRPKILVTYANSAAHNF